MEGNPVEESARVTPVAAVVAGVLAVLLSVAAALTLAFSREIVLAIRAPDDPPLGVGMAGLAVQCTVALVAAGSLGGWLGVRACRRSGSRAVLVLGGAALTVALGAVLLHPAPVAILRWGVIERFIR